MADLYSLLNNLNYTTLLKKRKGSFVIDDTIGVGLVFSALYHKKKGSYAIVSNNFYTAQRVYEFLLNFLPENDLVLFPSDELLRAEALSSSKELMAQRLYAMGQLAYGKDKILITHPSALLRFLPSKEVFKALTIDLKVGSRYSLEKMKTTLVNAGYTRVNKVDQSLQFALRGDILDIFSVNYLKPIRIEFFDDEIESIKYFDIASQSSNEKLDEIQILPASDFLLTDDQLNDFSNRFRDLMDKDLSHISGENDKDTYKQTMESDLEDILQRNYKNRLYRYYGFALNEANSILSYFDPEVVFVSDKEGFKESTDLLISEAREYFGELVKNHLCPTHLEEYMSLDEAFSNKNVSYGSKFSHSSDDEIFQTRNLVSTGAGLSSLIPLIDSYRSSEKIVLALSDVHQRETVKKMLTELKVDFEEVEGMNLPSSQLGVSDLSLNVGFELPSFSLAYISGSEIFGKKLVATRFSGRFKNATILKSYQDLKPGDYIVHEYNGIGQFIQVKTMETDGIHRDYLEIAYAGGDELFVPLDQFRLVRKYSGREGYAPKLSHLYSGDWEKKKSKIKGRVNDLADRLVALYGERAKVGGYAFGEDDDLQARFEDEFPYQLTPDQAKSLEEIKHDMERPYPMDRLLCGDVGFGKTEIAFRAAFKAIDNGKQVAMLAPTTLLARQHYEVAIERFQTFGIRIALLSRMVSAHESKLIFEGLEKGTIDLVIGTHRLLSKDIHFKDLGLLIVDEEQRFGVAQKEKIKEMKKDVDVLTLSATPIPRTLQMSLIGIRPVSTINTPPEARTPIQTYVTPQEDKVVYELIKRELSRNGQVFLIHNVISTIYEKGSKISKNVPSAKVGVVHGQMEREEIEEVMQKFYDGELNVLVATSIIENGIDVPNANMIIVENADKFGLSQLYQIKGRVGRGDRVAYAYLMYKPNKKMNDDAVKRLKAIQDFTELGSGYKIAQRDLMIRGAGDILGPEQAGFIDSVGLDLYLQLLNEAIEERKTGIKKEQPKSRTLFNIDAYIPKTYAIASDKVELYQDLEAAKNEEELDKVSKHMRDMYGKMPKQVELLIIQKQLNFLMEKEEFFKLEQTSSYVDILLSDSFTRISHIAVDLFNALLPYMNEIKVNFVDKKVHIRLLRKKKDDSWIYELQKIMQTVDELYNKRISE